MAWQWAIVILVQVVALAYLGRRFFGRRPSESNQRPDVPLDRLRRPGGETTELE